MTLTSAAKRWFNELPLKDRPDSMSLMIVSTPLAPLKNDQLSNGVASHSSRVCPQLPAGQLGGFALMT